MSRGLAIATKVVLARILFPRDFGVFALATGLIGFVSVLGNFGLDYALVQRGNAAREEDYEVALSLRSIISVVLFVCTIAIAVPWAAFFGDSSVAAGTQALAIVYLLSPWALIPGTKLMASLDYRRLVGPNVASQLTNSILAVSLAAAGFGFWSLIIALLVSQTVWVVTLWVACPWRPRIRFDWQIAKSLFGYSRHIVVASIITFLMTNIDNFTVGYFLGSSALGYYAVAYSLCLFSSMVSGSAASALFPTLSKMQEDLSRVKRGYLESFGYAGATVAPVALGLAVMSPEIVRVLLGVLWTPAIAPLTILAFYGFAKALVEFTTPLFASTGRPWAISRLNMMVLLGSLALLPPLTLQWGITGTALAMTIPFPFAVAISFRWAARILGVRSMELISRLRGSTLSAGLAVVVASAIKWMIAGILREDVTILVCATGIGVAVYLVSLRTLDPDVYHGLGRQLRLLVPQFRE